MQSLNTEAFDQRVADFSEKHAAMMQSSSDFQTVFAIIIVIFVIVMIVVMRNMHENQQKLIAAQKAEKNGAGSGESVATATLGPLPGPTGSAAVTGATVLAKLPERPVAQPADDDYQEEAGPAEDEEMDPQLSERLPTEEEYERAVLERHCDQLERDGELFPRDEDVIFVDPLAHTFAQPSAM